MEIRCLHDISQAGIFREAINAVNMASSRPDPFSTFEFYDNYICNIAPSTPGATLWFLLAFDERRLLGYIALRKSMHVVLGVSAAKISQLTANGADRPHLVTLPGYENAVRSAVYSFLLERRSEWSLLEFQEQDAESGLRPLPEGGAWGRYQIRRWPNLPNGTIAIRWSSLNEYFTALSKKMRSNSGRQLRALLGSGHAQYLSSDDPQGIKSLFELYRGIEKYSWKAKAGIGVGRDAQSLDFYSRLLDRQQPMRVRIHVLILDGTPVAGLISGAFGKGLYALQIVHDDRLGRFSPGSAILLMGIRLAIEGRYDFFNLLRGFGYYKERWLAQMSASESLQIYRIGTPFFWRRFLGDMKRRWESFLPMLPLAVGSPSFNPSKKNLEAPPCPVSLEQSPDLSSPSEREHYAALVAQVRLGKSEFLSAPALAETLLFTTQPRGRASPPSAPNAPCSASGDREGVPILVSALETQRQR